MGFLDKIKNLFSEQEFPVKSVRKAPEESKEEIKTEEVAEEHTQEKNVAEQDKPIVEFNPQEKQELLDILDSAKVDINNLALDKIQSESETISNYVKVLIKDLGLHQDFKNEKEKQEDVIKAIGSKVRLINNHGLELKNLLANLENHYYDPILSALKKVNKKTKKDEIQKLIDDLEKDLEIVKILDTQITKVIGYNDLFNPNKNPTYKEDIEKEAVKRVIHGDLNELLSNMLVAVTDRTLSVKNKIEKSNTLESAKSLF